MTGLEILGAVASAAGSVVSGLSAMAAGNYQNKVAQMNASIAEENAARAKQRSAIEAQDQDTQTAAMLGEQLAAQSASGVSLSSKSSILTRKAARELGRRDALNVIQGGEIEAYNYKVDAANQRAGGEMAKRQGQFGLLGGFLGGAQSLIGASSSTSFSFGKKATAPSRGANGDNWYGLRRRTV